MTPHTHSIRLRSPWELELVPSPAPPPGMQSVATSGSSVQLSRRARIEVPGNWHAAVPAGWQGSVRLRRRFQRPAALAPHERVFLVVEAMEPQGRLSLNGISLGLVPYDTLPAEFDITSQLAARNEIVIELEPGGCTPASTQQLGGQLGEVRLEIRSTA